ncbi:MAG: HAD hydrolase family protein, partial [Spirochaetales bacterium]|nr:HAD hydrolase family protein [Spirochaetales bacterium]
MTTHHPKPIAELPAQLCRNLKILFCDIDDTITEDGLLTSESYGALWRLHEAGIEVVPVTGRPAGWCDHIARMWP